MTLMTGKMILLVVRHPDGFAYSLTRRYPGGAKDNYLDSSPNILWE